MAFFQNLQSWLGNGFSMFVYIAIIALFVIGLLKCTMPVVHSNQLLKRACRTIRKGEDAQRSWQDDKFLGKGALMPHWSEYLNNLFFADGEYHNPANVEDFINEDTTILGPGRISLAEAIPSVLVSLGFLGTLLGLSVSLASLDTSAANLTSSVTNLISGMKYAFLTSVVGVIGSILFTLITRVVNGAANRTLTDFYNAMSRYAGVLSVDPMTQVAIYQQEQTVILQGIAKEIGDGRLNTTVANAMEQAVRPLNASLNDFITVSTQEQMRFLDTVVGRFVTRMNEALHGQFDQLSTTIANICQQQDKTASMASDSMRTLTGMTGELEKLQKSVSGMMENFNTYTEKVASAQSKAIDAYGKMNDTVEQLTITSRQQNDYLKSVSAMNAEVSRQLVQFETSSEKFLKTYADTLNQLNGISADMRDMNQAMGQRRDAAQAQLDKDIHESLDYFEGRMGDYINNVSWSVDNIQAAVKDLPAAVQGLTDQYLDQMNRLIDSFQQAQKALEDGARAMYRR